MPQSTWINNVMMIPEGKPYKVDSSSRIVVPAHLKAKFDIAPGDEMDCYTTFADNRWFICVAKHVHKEDEEEK